MYASGVSVHKKNHEWVEGCSYLPDDTAYPLGTTIPPPDRLGAVFTQRRGIGLLGSSRTRSCISSVPSVQKRATAGRGCGQAQTPCNADGWICRMLDAH
jgi:hypothetical protein